MDFRWDLNLTIDATEESIRRVIDKAMAREFVLMCKTRGGGFARKPKAAPFLYAIWHAVASLALLSKTSESSSGGYP